MHVHDSSRPDFIRSKQNSRGELASYYRLDVPVGIYPGTSGNGKHLPAEPASERTRHAVYVALCGALGLSAAHHAALVARGLSDEDIARGRYATLPEGSGLHRGRIAMAVLDMLKPQGIKSSDLLRVPGFIKRADVPIAMAGRAGMLIPVMDADATIGGMVLRPDKPALDPQGKPLGKYVWLTSSTRGGPGAVVTAHVPPIDAVSGAGFTLVAKHERVRLTEGPLKAHIATSKSGLLTVGLPGVGSWRLALPALKSLGTRKKLTRPPLLRPSRDEHEPLL